MGLKASLVGVLLASSPLVLGHPSGMNEKIYQHAYPRDLNHCSKHFKREEFVKRTAEIHGEELHRLRRAIGLEKEDS